MIVISRSIVCVLFLLAGSLHADIFDVFKFGDKENAKVILPSGIGERQEQLEYLKSELVTAKAQEKEFNDQVQGIWDGINQQINEVKSAISQADAKDIDFLNTKLSLLNELYQILFNIQFLHKGLINTIEQHIKILEDYLKDPDFKAYAPQVHAFYSFDDLEEYNKKVADQELRLETLANKKADAVSDLDNLKKKAASINRRFQEKKKEQDEFSAKGAATQEKIKDTSLTFKQKGELLDLERRLVEYEKRLAELKVQEATRRSANLEANIFIENEKLKALRGYLATIKSSLRVDKEDIQSEREKIDKTKQESLAARERYYETIKRLSAEKEKIKRELESLTAHYDMVISEARGAFDWSIENKTAPGYQQVCDVGLVNAHLHLIDYKIDLLKAQIELEKAALQHGETGVKIITIWYKITQRKFKDNEEVLQEIKRFKELEADAARELSIFKDRRNAITNLLNLLTKELSELKNTVAQMNAAKDTLFKGQPRVYTACYTRFSESAKILGEQQELSSKLIETYSRIINIISETKKDINVIISELESLRWQRSEYAISWQGLKNVVADMRYFIADVRSIGSAYFSTLRWRAVSAKINKFRQVPGNFLLLFLQLLAIVLGFFLLRRWLPRFENHVNAIGRDYQVFYYVSRILAVLFGFINDYLPLVYPWFVILVLIWTDTLFVEVFPKVMFYLLSIPFLLYLIPKFISYVVQFNEENKYVLFRKEFTDRFVLITSILLYSCALILPFREAFVLATIHKSEMPTILSALLSVIVRLLIIFSITKESLLALLPARGAFWNWLSSVIDRYYYLILALVIGIMILSDPYIGGYRNWVSYVVWGLLGSSVVIWLLYALHVYFKKISFHVFFQSEDESVRERFGYAKTLYGLWIIFLFLIFVIFGVFVASYLWQKPLLLEDLKNLLNYHIGGATAFTREGLPIYITPLKILVIILFILSGIFGAYLFNRFVIKKIFDILPVDIGIQNTIVSLTRYLIIIVAILLGFSWAGLTTLIWVIGGVAVGITYILKEPIGDLISYFIILVQRPIQIGDYVMIDSETQGFVRQITPRSVILRRKDSYTIIVPNSQIITHPINNWSYARNFIAFDDIHFAVPYKYDPEQIRSIIHQTLDKNLNVLKSPKPVIRLHEFGPDGFIFMVRGFISHTKVPLRFDITSDVRFDIIKSLRENGIDIAVPIRYIISKDRQNPPV